MQRKYCVTGVTSQERKSSRDPSLSVIRFAFFQRSRVKPDIQYHSRRTGQLKGGGEGMGYEEGVGGGGGGGYDLNS